MSMLPSAAGRVCLSTLRKPARLLQVPQQRRGTPWPTAQSLHHAQPSSAACADHTLGSPVPWRVAGKRTWFPHVTTAQKERGHQEEAESYR